MNRRRRATRDRETAFAFRMVGAFEMIKPLLACAQAQPDGDVTRRRFVDTVVHAVMMADAALTIRVFDMQMLRDGYLVRGALHALTGVMDQPTEADVPHKVVLTALAPALDGLLDADDRFFARLPMTTELQGIHDRTPVAWRAG